MLFLLLIFFSNAIPTHKEVAGFYGKSFPFFYDLTPVFRKDKAYDNAMGDIRDDATQYEHDNNITQEENVGFSQMPNDDFFMPMLEPTKSLLHIVLDNNALKYLFAKKKEKSYYEPNDGVGN